MSRSKATRRRDMPRTSRSVTRGWTAGRVLASLCGLLLLTAAVIPGVLAPYDPVAIDPNGVLASPSREHLLGTDINGMDILSRLIWSARIDVAIALLSTLIAIPIGSILGAIAGFHFGRRTTAGFVTDLMMRVLDAVQAFPVFVLALALVAVLGRDVFNLIYVLVFVHAPLFLRLTRTAVIRTRQELYVDAALMAGNSPRRVLFRHVLPNSLSPTVVNASVVSGGAILLTAGLSFVGAGVEAPTAEWGYMVAVGAQSLYTGQWWPALFPGIAIGIAVLCFAQLGEWLRVAIDPLGARHPRGGTTAALPTSATGTRL